jgi:uncharacterized membrane protein
MRSDVVDVPVSGRAHPILLVLASFPIACFTSALVTDLAYAQTANIMWADFSDWLLALGMAGGVLAAIAGLVDLIANRRRHVLPVVIGSLVALALALLNNFVHSRDAWTSVVPTGLALSALTVLVVLITAWLIAPRRQMEVRV